jgi:hypothetical protein
MSMLKSHVMLPHDDGLDAVDRLTMTIGGLPRSFRLRQRFDRHIAIIDVGQVRSRSACLRRSTRREQRLTFQWVVVMLMIPTNDTHTSVLGVRSHMAVWDFPDCIQTTSFALISLP